MSRLGLRLALTTGLALLLGALPVSARDSLERCERSVSVAEASAARCVARAYWRGQVRNQQRLAACRARLEARYDRAVARAPGVSAGACGAQSGNATATIREFDALLEPGAPAAASGRFTASDGAEILYFERGDRANPTLLISPAFTSSPSNSVATARAVAATSIRRLIAGPSKRPTNGKGIGLLLWNTLVNTYTDLPGAIAKAGLPVLVYGGKMSIVPWQVMQWTHEQIPGSEFILFDESVGVHGAFLNPAPSGDAFMARVRDFFERRVQGAGD